MKEVCANSDNNDYDHVIAIWDSSNHLEPAQFGSLFLLRFRFCTDSAL